MSTPTVISPSSTRYEPTSMHDGDREPADQLHAGAVDGGEPTRPVVGAPVAVVEVLEDLLVAGFATEGVDGVDPAEALDEVDDHQATASRVAR